VERAAESIAGLARRLHLCRIDIGKVDAVIAAHARDSAAEARGLSELKRAGIRRKPDRARIGGTDLYRGPLSNSDRVLHRKLLPRGKRPVILKEASPEGRLGVRGGSRRTRPRFTPMSNGR